MSLNRQGQSCAVCHSYLFDDDDIVYCPVCGAPHHRDCYNSVGHCGLEELHGTDKQYDKVSKTTETTNNRVVDDNSIIECAFCHSQMSLDSQVCPTCGRPRLNTGFMQIDFLGGVPRNKDIGDGITANEAKDFVAVNTPKYMRKFASGKKVSWNWVAFLFPEGWFLSRKMFKTGFFVIALLVAATILLFPFMQILQTQAPGAKNYFELFDAINKIMPTVDILTISLLFISSGIRIAVSIFSGLFGDYWYKRYVIRSLKSEKRKEYEKLDYNQKYGGVNILWALLGYIIVSYLPSIVLSLI